MAMDQRIPAPGLWRFVDDDHPAQLTLIVKTPNGPYLRRISPALPLPPGVVPGAGAELAIHQAAATWGMPDFVFEPAYAVKGSGRREQGDGLLLSGGRGAVLQSKRRTVPPKDDASERSWLQKNAAKALGQARGTVRQLRMQSANMANGRGRTLNIDGHAYEWIALIVLDHERVPVNTVLELDTPAGMPAIAVTRKDLDFLFHQLRSTTAVLDYLFRVAPLPGVALGEEPVRYYELAAADLAAEPEPMNPELVGVGGRLQSAPLLPQAPAGGDGTPAHVMIRLVLEDLATSPLDGYLTEANRLQVLHDVDRLPVAMRTEWGRLLIGMLDDVRHIREGGCKWRFRRHLTHDGARQLIFGAATRFGPDIQAAFSAYVQLRHHEVGTRSGLAEVSTTLGVLLTPRHDGYRAWDTTMVRTHGQSHRTEVELKTFADLWNGVESQGEE
ncbi:hypothetical protein ACIQOF_17965 [Streptomyces sp. NPDC091265]|uniref:hypothetical protein n=1 Tax=Streptomyces sp. NPDC091265 TaxID=3365977 RepID=UPI003827F0CD